MPQITIDASVQQAQRITAALGKERNLVDENGVPRDATVQEVKYFLIDMLKRLVLGVEHREAREAVPVPPSVDLT